MVYNAMKLFMEINPQLFDECSHDYTEMQNTADQRKQARQSKWDKLAEQARQKQNGVAPVIPPLTSNMDSNLSTPLRSEEADPLAQDNQKRLDALKIQDENPAKERRLRDHDKQSSVGTSVLLP